MSDVIVWVSPDYYVIDLELEDDLTQHLEEDL
jgi:hypothetical protein